MQRLGQPEDLWAANAPSPDGSRAAAMQPKQTDIHLHEDRRVRTQVSAESGAAHVDLTTWTDRDRKRPASIDGGYRPSWKGDGTGLDFARGTDILAVDVRDEPPLVDGYVDTFNGGCDADDQQFRHHDFDPAFGYAAVEHGRSGWFDDGSGNTAIDTDWYWVRIDAQGSLEVSIEATEACRVTWFEAGSNCDDLVYGGTMSVYPGGMNTMDVSGPYASDILVRVRPLNSEPLDGFHREFEYLLGVNANGWERPYHAPLGDQVLEGPALTHERNRISMPLTEFEDDYAPWEVCGDSAGVAVDGLAQVYLWQGQRIGVGSVDIWYPDPAVDSDRDTEICLSLTTDARMTPGSCVESHCGIYSQWGFTHEFTAPQSGWYWLICDTAPSIEHGPFAFVGDLEHIVFEDQTLRLVVDSWGIGPRPFALTGHLDSVTRRPRRRPPTPASTPSGPTPATRPPPWPLR
ncbi:MAG: hypothetical protein R3D98_10490 [Candidatus Krumholzibacteriia bacterium]